MKDRNFLKHFTIIGAGTLINMFLGVITTPLITRLVDPEEYGQLSIFTMYGSIAVMVLCLGLDQALVRYYYEHENEDEKRALLFRCVKLPVIISALVAVAVIVLSATRIVVFEFNTLIMVLLCIYTVVEVIYRFSSLLIRLAYKSKLFSILNILKKLCYIGLAFPMLLIFDDSDEVILVVCTVASAVFCFLISVFAQQNMWDISKNKNSKCHVSSHDLLVYAYPYVFSLGIATLFQAIDKISLNMYCSYAEVGIYSSTMTLVNIFAIIQTTFNTLWQPMAVEHYTNNPEDRDFYQKGNQVITVVMFLLGISLILVKDIFAILLGEKYRDAAYILPFLVFNPIMYTISETTVSGLVFLKKSKQQVLVSIGACVANIIGNTILVPELGCQGAAISTGLSYIVFFTLRTFLSNRYFYIDYKLKKFYFLTAVVLVYAFYNTFTKCGVGTIVGYAICLFVLILLYKKTIFWCMKYLKGYLTSMIKTKKI